MIAVCAMLCGAEGFTDIALWGRCQHGWLKTWLALPNGIPAHDTFNRVFDLIAFSEFAACFQSWTQALRQAVADKSNELPAVPQLLRALELTGCVVTVEALNCRQN